MTGAPAAAGKQAPPLRHGTCSQRTTRTSVGDLWPDARFRPGRASVSTPFTETSERRPARATLLAIAMIAVVGLTVAVVVLASEHDTRTTTTSATGRNDSARSEFRLPSHAREHGFAPVPDLRVAPLPNGQRYDGGPEEGTRGMVTEPEPSTRYDGGPEEGSLRPRQ